MPQVTTPTLPAKHTCAADKTEIKPIAIIQTRYALMHTCGIMFVILMIEKPNPEVRRRAMLWRTRVRRNESFILILQPGSKNSSPQKPIAQSSYGKYSLSES